MPRPGSPRPRDRWRSDITRAPLAIGSQLVQLYGEPNAETHLYTFEDWARNIYGACGWPGNSIFFTAIDRRASLFSEATFKYRDLKTKKIFGDPSLSILEKPWPGATSSTLLTRMEQDASLAGNAYIRGTLLDGAPRLERLRPDWVTLVSRVIPDDLGEEVRELLGIVFDPQGADPDRRATFLPISEVAHWAPIPDPLANFRGMSWISPALRELRSDIRTTEYREAYFKNSATPNVVIRYEQRIAPERVERLRNAINARHAGAENAFGTLVLDEGADLTVVGSNMEQAGLDVLEAAVETRILMAAGVPAIVAGARQGLQASQIGEYAQALRAFADLKIRPNWRSGCAALEKLVSPPSGAQLWYDTSDVSALQPGEQDAAATSFQQTQAIVQLVMQGFTPDSAVQAVISGDMSLLVHTGAQSVQVQAGSGTPALAGPTNGSAPKLNGNAPALAGAN